MKLSELLSKPLKLKGRNTGVLDLRGFAKQVVDMELGEVTEITENEASNDNN